MGVVRHAVLDELRFTEASMGLHAEAGGPSEISYNRRLRMLKLLRVLKDTQFFNI